MAAPRRSPQELYPDLFAKPAAKAAAVELGPKDLRLLQWSMQRANHRPATRRTAEADRRDIPRYAPLDRRQQPPAR